LHFIKPLRAITPQQPGESPEQVWRNAKPSMASSRRLDAAQHPGKVIPRVLGVQGVNEDILQGVPGLLRGISKSVVEVFAEGFTEFLDGVYWHFLRVRGIRRVFDPGTEYQAVIRTVTQYTGCLIDLH
jgi:hypothetical protein